MLKSDYDINTRYRKRRDSKSESPNYSTNVDYGKDRLRSPLIAFGILFVFMGLWMMVKPHISNDGAIQSVNDSDSTKCGPQSAWEEVREAAKESTELYQAMVPVKFKNPGYAFDIKIPTNHKGELLITNAVLIDADSLNILWSYRGGERGQIASMTKMMLTLVAYVYADSGFISFDDTVYVTDEAPLMGGSQAYLDRGERYHVRDLIRAVTISSANDAAYLLAQYLGDNDVSATVDLMNTFSKKLELKQTQFYNVHGLPPTRSKAIKVVTDGVGIQKYKGRNMYVATKANYSTPLEMAKLGVAITRLPELLKWSSIRHDSLWDVDCERAFGAYKLNNHFKIMGIDSIDGIKTGYTVGAGYCVTASAKRNGRRLIAVVFGSKFQNTRDDFVRELFNKGYEFILPEKPDLDTLSQKS